MAILKQVVFKTGLKQRGVVPQQALCEVITDDRMSWDRHVQDMMLTASLSKVNRWMAQSACDEPWNNISHVPHHQLTAVKGTAKSGYNHSVVSSMEAHRGSEAGQ